ncbi:MAG: cupin domain-containing protein [Pseudomonadota bacterium]
MNKQIARFKDVVPVALKVAQDKGIPAEVFELITARITRNIMSPGPLPGILAPKPVVEGGFGGVIRLGIASCPPGNGPGLHVHYKTHETFMALTGKWEMSWGDEGEHKTILEPYDLCACPPGVMRRFVNLSDSEAHLLVVIQGERDDFEDTDRAYATGQKVAAKYGQTMLDKLEAHGWNFTVGRDKALARAAEEKPA